MGRISLLAVTLGEAEADRGTFDGVLERWPRDDRPRTRVVTVGDFMQDPAIASDSQLAWVHGNGHSITSEVYELIGRLQDRQVPTLLTQSDNHLPIGTLFLDGVVTAPSETPPDMLHAMLSALASQVGTLRSLRAETDLLRLEQGGLCDQIGKMDEELRMAAQLQRDMLPTGLPANDRVRFKILYRPAGYVSGDIYDIVQLDDDHIALFVADAVGHGVPAALLTVFIKRSLHEAQIGRRKDDGDFLWPADALARLNAEMVRHQSAKTRFATACYGVLNCRTMHLTLSRAGHPYPLILRSGGEREWITPDGGLLGVFPDEQYETQSVPLHPGDRLVLYSDGFELAFPPERGAHDGVDHHRYQNELFELANGPLDLAYDRLSHRIDEEAGSLHQGDDLTALIMEVGTAA